jgi:hypothetical protein
MNRTADEALYDCVRPLIPYEAPTPWTKIIDKEQCDRVQAKELCAGCLAEIVPFKDSFTMDAGHGGIYQVTENSGLCRSCFNALRENPPKYRKVPRVQINYAFGTEALQTIEDLIE